MRFFGYYALHSFVNQLRKLFKTWVLVFFVVCMAIGGIIGVGAAMLDQTIEQNREPEAITEPVEAEEAAEEPEDTGTVLPPDALMELIAGGAILALFFFEAVSADKNGSKIFLPADVNLLFPSPMKPQSVLMFRLGTQLGTALVATIYIVFQLPNLMLNAGLSGWAAAAILITWFASIFIGKLLQVLLYTLCSSHLEFKKYLRKGTYAFGAVLAAGFLVYYRASGQEILTAADHFFNAPFTRWIPFWGWLKGLAVFVSQRNWLGAAAFLGLLSAGGAGLVYGIWHINADFYEDAMAKSEETAALLEKARSEKTSGTAATRQRKHDRKESLLRDGFHSGHGANVFFYKTMYNRFRFAHFGFLTKTMETYFVAALGTAAAAKFFFGYTEVLPVALVLGVLVFFRAMGDPLAEDTGMDFFRLIPESTWQKLFFSLLGGTVSCLMDLILPMLAASVLLMANPLKLLIWLPLIVSVDFYATSVVTFIDLSVPASIGKTIKQVITIMFIYFGLLPDIGLLAFGIVLGHTVSASVAAAVLNLALGIVAFSLASVFLQPKGKDYVKTVRQDLRAASRQFSRIGFAIFAILALVTALQIVAAAAISAWAPSLLESSWAIWMLTFVPQYLVAMPAGLLLLRRVPAHAPQPHKLGKAGAVRFLFISVFVMYAGNLIGTVITALLGLLIRNPVVNPLESYVTGENLIAQVLIIVILAPIIEEFVFRKQLIDRMGIYGGKTAVILSALLFGLFHGNFSQFFYAFGLGLVFGYIYLNTGKLRYTVIAHMGINFFGSVYSTELLKRVPLEALDAGEVSILELLRNPFAYLLGGHVLFLLAGSVAGLVLLCMRARNLTFPAGALELPKGKRFAVTIVNFGMMLILLSCTAMMIRSVIG